VSRSSASSCRPESRRIHRRREIAFREILKQRRIHLVASRAAGHKIAVMARISSLRSSSLHSQLEPYTFSQREIPASG
jgi:hypothetical protein